MKNRFLFTFLLAFILFFITSNNCFASAPPLPSNVDTSRQYYFAYDSSVDFPFLLFYPSSAPDTYAHDSFCIAKDNLGKYCFWLYFPTLDEYKQVSGYLNWCSSNGVVYSAGRIDYNYPNTILNKVIVPVYDSLPPKPNQTVVDNGLGYDITLSHTEFKYPLTSSYWEFISVKGAWNYPTVTELSFDVFVNGEKRDTINKLNNFSTNFGVAFDFFTSHYNVVEGDTIRILCTPLGDNVKGLARGVEWIVGSKENISISKIPNVTPKVDINNVPYTPSIQKERQFIYNPITNEYVTNNYYTQNYENFDLSNIENQLDYIIQYITDNPVSSGADTPQTIINYNTTNKNYNLNFGDFDIGDIDIDLEIGNAKEHVKNSFDEFITNIQLLMDSPFEIIVISFGVGIGLVILVLAIVIVAKILDIIIP